MAERRAWATLLIATLVSLSTAGATRPEAKQTLDDGRLDLAWFGEGLEFREVKEIDYLWVRPGFSLDGHKLRFVPFGDPQFLGEVAAKRGPKEHQLALELNPNRHKLLATSIADALGKRISIVSEGEDVRVEGRIVDCGEGGTSLTFVGPVPIGGPKRIVRLTVDIKFLDAATGELLAAIHHRAVTHDWSKWTEDMSEHVADDGFAKLYAKGKRAKD